MKRLFIFLSLLEAGFQPAAQSTQNTLVETGKVLVELVRIFKKGSVQKGLPISVNGTSDLCFANSSNDQLNIEVSRKISDTEYKVLPGSVSLTPQSHECLLELTPGIYHYRVYKRNNGVQALSLEGELKLVANEKMQREIK